MKYFILSGEASGDLHSAAVAKSIFTHDPEAMIMGWGGEEMQAAGVRILKHYRELAFMGFVEVIKHLPQIFRNFREAKAQIMAFKPDAVILTDYPGFNLRMAKWAHRSGFKVFYYISPQLWAWKEGRVKYVRRFVDHMYVILPFEEAFYAKHGIDVTYVGHPLARRIRQIRESGQVERQKNELVLLPGSRKREIADMLPVMLEAVRERPDFNITVAGAPSVPAEYYYPFLAASGIEGVQLTFGYTYRLLQKATVAFCTSGTATLETALFGVPQIVCYKGDRLSYLIARRLIKVPYIAMANLICGKAVVPELIQDDFNVRRLRDELNTILEPSRLELLQADYTDLQNRLDSGNPAEQVAADIIRRLQS